ncbi:hypothetical protein BGZ73_000120 [Actinomortierella ambigua]|nr:hypothetical protein BGZ73_000120 [Actinomortierella ambigua]
MASKPNEGESMRDFCDRVEGLLAAAGDETFEQMLIRSLYNRLPQNGREMVLRRFKSLKDISDPADLLDFFVVHPGIFEGPKVDNALWHRDRLGASKSVPHSSAPAGNGRRANKNKGKRRRAASRRAMAAPYPTGGGGGGSTSPSTAPCPPVPGTICQEQVCRILGKRWHDASLCFKYTRKNVWRRMEATANEVLRHAQEPSPSLYSPEPSPVPYSPEYSPRPYSPVHSPRQYSPERSPSPYSPEPFADSTSYTSADELDQRHKWESPLPPKRGKRHNYRGGRGRRGR